MSYEEEFDRIMRQKAEEMDYPFEEAHWEKASEMISRSRGGGREVVRSLIWSAVVITAGGLFTLMWFGTGDNRVPEQPAVSSSETVSARPATLSPDESGAQASSLHDESAKVGLQLLAARPAVVVKPSMEAQPENNLDATRSDMHDKVPAATRDVGTEQPGADVRTASSLKMSWQQEAQPEAEITSALTNSGGEDQDQPAEEFIEAKTIADFDFLAAKQSLLDYVQADKEALPHAIVAVKGDDDYVSKRRSGRTCFVNLEAGAAFWTGWQAEGSHSGRGINWFGGANVGFFAGDRWFVSTGLQLFNFAHLDAPFYTAGSKTYGFSSVTTNTVITTRELRYAGVPLRIGYTFAGGGQLRAGIIGAQLWYARNDIEITTGQNEEVSQTSSRVSRSLYDGMNQQLLMFTAGYGVRLSERVNAGVDVVYGVTDLFSSRTYLQRTERPLVIRAGVTFRILEK